MMHGSNGSPSDRYLPMDYGMHHGHAPHPSAHGQPTGPHPHHPDHPHLAAAAHYALPPSHHAPLGAAPPPSVHHGMKRSPESAGLDMMSPSGGASSDEEGSMHDVKPALGDRGAGRGSSLKGGGECPPAGKKTKGRVKIKMEFIDNKLRRYTTFSKRKTGIMKKAYELSTLTGTQVMLLVASETGHVYTFATRKLQPMITSDAGKALIQTCLNSPDPPQASQSQSNDQRMSAQGYEETELTYNAIADAAAAAAADAAEQQKDHNLEEQDTDDEEEEEIEISEQQHNQISDEDDEEDEEDYHDYRADQQRRHRTVAQHRQGAGGVSGVPVAHPQLQHPLHPSAAAAVAAAKAAAAVMAGPSVHHQPLFSTTSSQGKSSEASSSKTSSSSNTSTSISTGGSNLPPEVISQLLATGHLVREDGTLVRLSSVPSSAGLPYSFAARPRTSTEERPGTSSVTITAKDLSKKSNPSKKD